MREDPNGAALLQAATPLLREEMLQTIPAEKRHDALMIANAMSIAMRQLEYGEAPERAELQAVRLLLGRGVDEESALTTLNRELARTIRSGRADPGADLHCATLAHLRATTRQPVLESAPKVLKQSA